MQKKGQGYTDEMMLFSILVPLLAIILGIGMFWYASSNADLDEYWKNFYSKDLALTLDAVYGVNGEVDMIYLYRSPDHHYAIEVSEGVVRVSTQEEPQHPATFHFAKSLRTHLEEAITLMNSAPLLKQPLGNNDWLVRFRPSSGERCAYATTQNPDYKTLPHHVGLFTEGEAAEGLVEVTRQQLDLAGITLIDEPATAAFRLFITQKPADHIVIYHQSSSNPKSKRYACLLANRLSEQGFAVTVQPLFLRDQYLVLDPDPSLLITVGQDMDSAQRSTLATSIEQSIHEYYG